MSNNNIVKPIQPEDADLTRHAGQLRVETVESELTSSVPTAWVAHTGDAGKKEPPPTVPRPLQSATNGSSAPSFNSPHNIVAHGDSFTSGKSDSAARRLLVLQNNSTKPNTSARSTDSKVSTRWDIIRNSIKVRATPDMASLASAATDRSGRGRRGSLYALVRMLMRNQPRQSAEKEHAKLLRDLNTAFRNETVWNKVHRDGLVPTDLYEKGTRQFVELAVKEITSGQKQCRSCSSARQGTCPIGIVNPDKRFRSLWDTFILILVLYTGIAIPLQVALFPVVSTAWSIFGTVIDGFFWLDIVINFLTAYHDDERRLERQFLKIARRYLSSWFVIDLLSVFPVELLVTSESQSVRIVNGLKTLRLMRLAKFFKKLDSFKFANIWGLVRLFLFVFLLMHWVACGWVLYSNAEDPDPVTGFRWYDLAGMDLRSVSDQYITALIEAEMMLFRTMLIGAHTEGEKWFVVMVNVVGSALNAVIFGEVAHLISTLNIRFSRHRRRMRDVNERMRYHGLPESIQRRVQHYYDSLWEHHRLTDQDQMMDFIEGLSEPLQMEVKLFMNRDMVAKVPMFRDCDASVIVQVVNVLQNHLYLPGDYVVREGERADRMYFIRRGVCQVLIRKDRTLAKEDQARVWVDDQFYVRKTLTDGHYFGEIALLFHVKRTATICAVTYSDLSSLLYNDFERIIDENPDFAAAVEEGFAQYIPNEDEQGPLNVKNARKSLLTLMDRRHGNAPGTAANGPLGSASLVTDEVGNVYSPTNITPTGTATSIPTLPQQRRRSSATTLTTQDGKRGRRPSIALREALARRVEHTYLSGQSDKEDPNSDFDDDDRREFIKKLYGRIQNPSGSGASGDDTSARSRRTKSYDVPPAGHVPFLPNVIPPARHGGSRSVDEPMTDSKRPSITHRKQETAPASIMKSNKKKSVAIGSVAVAQSASPTLQPSPDRRRIIPTLTIQEAAAARKSLSPPPGTRKLKSKKTGFGSAMNTWDDDGTGNIIGSSTAWKLRAAATNRRRTRSKDNTRGLVGSVTSVHKSRRRASMDSSSNDEDSDEEWQRHQLRRPRPRRRSLPVNFGTSKWIRERQSRERKNKELDLAAAGKRPYLRGSTVRSLLGLAESPKYSIASSSSKSSVKATMQSLLQHQRRRLLVDLRAIIRDEVRSALSAAFPQGGTCEETQPAELSATPASSETEQWPGSMGDTYNKAKLSDTDVHIYQVQ